MNSDLLKAKLFNEPSCKVSFYVDFSSPDGRRHSRVVTVTPAISRTEENSVFKMPFLERFLKYLGLSLIQ